MSDSASRCLYRGDFLALHRSAHWEYVRRTRSSGGTASEDTTHCVPLASMDEWLRAQAARPVAIDPRVFAALYWLSRPAEPSRPA